MRSDLHCIIDSAINKYFAKGKSLDVIKRYIQMRYKINMDSKSIKERIKARKKNYEFPRTYSSM